MKLKEKADKAYMPLEMQYLIQKAQLLLPILIMGTYFYITMITLYQAQGFYRLLEEDDKF